MIYENNPSGLGKTGGDKMAKKKKKK